MHEPSFAAFLVEQRNIAHSELAQAVAERDQAVAERDQAVAERDQVLNSRLWKTFKPYRKFRNISKG